MSNWGKKTGKEEKKEKGNGGGGGRQELIFDISRGKEFLQTVGMLYSWAVL